MNIMKKWNSTTTIACLTSISSHTGDVVCFPGWYGYTLTPFLHKRNRTLIAIIILQYHRLFKIALFSHCFPEKKNQQLEFLLSCWFLMWTSQGLNLGPPDYESICNIFHKIINNHKTLIFNAFFILQISENCLTLQPQGRKSTALDL